MKSEDPGYVLCYQCKMVTSCPILKAFQEYRKKRIGLFPAFGCPIGVAGPADDDPVECDNDPLEAIRPSSWAISETGIQIYERSRGKYAVVSNSGDVLNDRFVWEEEPLPSNRTTDFLKRARFDSLELAHAAFVTWQQRIIDGSKS